MTQTHDAETVDLQRINSLARILMATWQKVDPNSNVSLHPASYTANFADMARAALSAMPPQEVSVQEAAKLLPRNEGDGGWVLDTDLTFGVSAEIQRAGWDCTPEIVELAMLAAERALAQEPKQ